MIIRAFSLVILVLGSASLGAAQEAALEPLEVGPSGVAYERAIRFKGIDSDVAYYDPTRPVPPLGTSEAPPERPRGAWEQADGKIGVVRAVTIAATTLGLTLALYLFVKFGGAGSISFADAPANAARRRRGSEPGDAWGGGAQAADLDAIVMMTDRREALVALSGHVLARLVSAQGVLLQRSWTAREALLRIPRDIAHWQALRNLVLASEKAHFGDRDVTDEEFRAHLDEVRPLLTGVAG